MDLAKRYFELFVVPNFRAYTLAEQRVNSAFKAINPEELEAANRWALAAAMNAALPTYHMADIVFHDAQNWNGGPKWLGKVGKKIGDFKKAIERDFCLMGRDGPPANDLTLLGAVVDAFKHAELRNKARPVTSIRATIVTTTGYGELGYGEGKYGGIDQVIVRIHGRNSRAFSLILQNNMDMWRRVLGLPLEPYGS